MQLSKNALAFILLDYSIHFMCVYCLTYRRIYLKLGQYLLLMSLVAQDHIILALTPPIKLEMYCSTTEHSLSLYRVSDISGGISVTCACAPLYSVWYTCPYVAPCPHVHLATLTPHPASSRSIH